MKNVMFVCLDSTCSIVAEAWMRYIAKGAISVTSSGLSVGQVSPKFVQAMDEVDLNIRGMKTKLISDYNPKDFDAVISLCNSNMRLSEDWMLRRVFDEWVLPQIQDESLESYRQIRDDIRDKIDILLMRYST